MNVITPIQLKYNLTVYVRHGELLRYTVDGDFFEKPNFSGVFTHYTEAGLKSKAYIDSEDILYWKMIPLVMEK